MNAELAFQERVRGLRKDKGASQQKVADGIGITKIGYQYYEYGKKMPGFGTLLKLADFFNVSADYLLGRSDEPRMPDKEDWAILKQIYKAREDKQDSPKE